MNKNIREKLFLNKDIDYQKFSSNLLPGISNIIGVRIPILRKIAREIVQDKPYYYLDNVYNDYFEEIMIEGLVIGYLKDDYNKVEKYILRFIPKINNWSICDTFCSNLKITNKYKKDIYEIVKKQLKNNNEFANRFSLVMLLNYYIEEDYIDKIFKIVDSIKSEAYYVKMAQAWLIQSCYSKYKNKTITYLQNDNLDNWTHNKAIQKIVESYKTNDNDKNELRMMKRK